MRLQYFNQDEFITPRGDDPHYSWWPKMSPELLVKLDILRHQWGAPIRLSRVDGGIGREGQSAGTSQHSVTRWGEVRAVDCFPERVVDAYDARVFIDLATMCGFTGIGVYPHWNGGLGFHLDVRADRDVGDPALWGAVSSPVGGQAYVPLSDALEAIA